MKYIYTIWFRDSSFPVDDPEYEWPACFVVDASSAADAVCWGDRLASAYSVQANQEMLTSSVEPLEASDLLGTDELPVVPYGCWARDDEIGW